ncbi:MAG: FAD-dependent oxidoreductase, partial [Bacteroidota bacterium]
MVYDVIIVGAGPAGIFTAYELVKERSNLKILILEKGRDIHHRKCPKHTNGGSCVNCKPCSITTGWAGAGAYSDGKLSLSHEVGGMLTDYIGVEQTMEMIGYTDDIYLNFGADSKIHGATETPAMREIRRKSIEANLKLVPCPVRHLGTEKTQQLYRSIYEHLIRSGVEVRFNTAVEEFIINNNQIEGLKCSKEFFYAKRIVVA